MENTENLVLEHLRHIRGRVDQIAEDMGDLKLRMSGLERALTLVKREAHLSEETAANFFRRRAGRANPADFQEILDKVEKKPPLPGDEMPVR